MNAGIQRNLTSGLAGWFVAQVRKWGRSADSDAAAREGIESIGEQYPT
jgi:hypothetical protein